MSAEKEYLRRGGVLMAEKEREVTEGTEDTHLETLFARLEEVTQEMEQADITLEEAFTLYHEGMKLLHRCGEKIDRIEKQVQILDEDGELHEF